ncbi:MAG: glycosyltransferase [Armatimonadia bacterium]|nr:glycosyltransferase [Armatimonadia bacterium]
MSDLSVIIPARNEQFLQPTIDSVLSASRGDTEVIVILDGYSPDPPLREHHRLRVISLDDSIGQRAATNEGVRASSAKYVMKLDAHCKMANGFDMALAEDCDYLWTVVPRMYSLEAFRWVCDGCKYSAGQGPRPQACAACSGTEFSQRIVWHHHKPVDYMWFDPDLRIHYFDSIGLKPYGGDKKKYAHKFRSWAKGEITDVLCGIGACFFMHRERYWELGGMDEQHGSWGQMAVEVALKAWLSGGRHVVNKGTWFAHMFRTQAGFLWPYENPSSAQERAREYSRDLWLHEKWSGQKRSLQQVIDKFAPLPGWQS